jgi:hypothetical protein
VQVARRSYCHQPKHLIIVCNCEESWHTYVIICERIRFIRSGHLWLLAIFTTFPTPTHSTLNGYHGQLVSKVHTYNNDLVLLAHMATPHTHQPVSEMDTLVNTCYKYSTVAFITATRGQWWGRFLGIIGWDPSVCKSNQLHVDILWFSFIELRYIL